jgi:putative DNA primase/helicase
MTTDPTIAQWRLDRIVARVHGEEQRAHAGEPALLGDPPPDAAPSPGDKDAPPSHRSRVDPNDPRPEIVLSTDQPPVVEKALHALALLGGVYVRGRQLVHVVRDHGAPDWFLRPAGSPVIVPIERDHLLDLLGRAALWCSMKDGVSHRASPPTWVASRILARGEWKLPQLEAISDAPVFRADGTIHDTPGYDERTRVIFDPCGAAFPPIPSSPTRADAERALVELVEPFSEFPFVADSDRAACAAFVLSVTGRPAIHGQVPMFGVQAPTPGSGKGLLADAAAMIPTGRKAPLMAPTDEDEETRKRLLAIAMESPPIVVIDNVDGVLGSPALAMALTAGQVSDRLLGSTRMVTASLRPVWAFTGNNVQLKGDLGRRVVPIDLDPKVEHPEDRTFRRTDLLGYVQENRPRLVVAALTVLRAFVVAGSPAHALPAKGSFEAWDALVRGAILWAGGADPLGGVKRIRDRADEDLDRLRALLAAWRQAFEGTAHTLAEAIKHAGTSGDLHDALAAFCRSGKPEAKPIGYAFRKAQGRPVGSKVLRREEFDGDGIARWVVQLCE